MDSVEKLAGALPKLETGDMVKKCPYGGARPREIVLAELAEKNSTKNDLETGDTVKKCPYGGARPREREIVLAELAEKNSTKNDLDLLGNTELDEGSWFDQKIIFPQLSVCEDPGSSSASSKSRDKFEKFVIGLSGQGVDFREIEPDEKLRPYRSELASLIQNLEMVFLWNVWKCEKLGVLVEKLFLLVQSDCKYLVERINNPTEKIGDTDYEDLQRCRQLIKKLGDFRVVHLCREGNGPVDKLALMGYNLLFWSLQFHDPPPAIEAAWLTMKRVGDVKIFVHPPKEITSARLKDKVANKTLFQLHQELIEGTKKFQDVSALRHEGVERTPPPPRVNTE